MRKIKWSILFLMCILVFAGCSRTTTRTGYQEGQSEPQKDYTAKTNKNDVRFPARQGGVIKLTLGYSTNSEDPRGIAAQQFKQEVEENTKGTVTIDIYPDAKLGSDAQLIAGVISGQVDMTISSAGNFSGYVKNEGVSALPFLFDSFEEAWRFMDSEIVQDIDAELLNYNIRVLSHFDNGFRCVTTKDVPVDTPDDMIGLKIRTPDNAIVKETMSELGARPVTLDFSELKDALKNNQFDAQENPVPIIYNNALYEVQNCLSITNHSYDAMPFVMSDAAWQMLTKEEQRVIREAAMNAQQTNRELVRQQTEDYVARLENECNMTVTYPDLTLFKEKTENVAYFFCYDEELLEKIRSFVDRNR